MVGVALALLWNAFHPVQYSDPDGITIFIAVFFFGIGALIYAIKGESMSGRLKNSWIVAVLSLGFSLWVLFESIFHHK
jgi:ABC-type Mn2+/Zn2+ transport system permease subunit